MERKAIEDIKKFEEHRCIVSVAYAQTEFVRRYAEKIPEEDRIDFQRELAYLVHLIYREAQQPLVQQFTDVIVAQNRPLIFPIGPKE